MEEHKQRLDADPGSHVKLSEYPVKSDADESEKLIQFLCTVGKLKTIDRTGWILDPKRTVRKPESVAGHMYRMGIMSMMFGNSNETNATDNGDLKNSKSHKLDIFKIIQMSLVHDMAECITGDITPYDNLTEDEKHRRESEAMKNLVALLPSSISQKFSQLYDEYEARETDEAKVVKELDRFDVMLQAFQYEREEWNKNQRVIRFDEFFHAAQKYIHTPMLRSMLDKINQERDSFLKKVGDNNSKVPNAQD